MIFLLFDNIKFILFMHSNCCFIFQKILNHQDTSKNRSKKKNAQKLLKSFFFLRNAAVHLVTFLFRIENIRSRGLLFLLILFQDSSKLTPGSSPCFKKTYLFCASAQVTSLLSERKYARNILFSICCHDMFYVCVIQYYFQSAQ